MPHLSYSSRTALDVMCLARERQLNMLFLSFTGIRSVYVW